MSTEQEDAVLLLELEEKITHRIREQIRMMADGIDQGMGPLHPSLCSPSAARWALIQNIRQTLLNDPNFITEITKRIGQRMTTIY